VSEVRLTHIGGPTVLLEVEGWRILSDPTFDPPGRTYGFGWGTSSRKLTGPAVTPEAVGPVDLVLVSHDHHGDNLDDAGRGLLASAGVVVTTVAGARRLGGGARGLRPWQETVVEHPDRPALTITATPCRHGPPLSRPVAGPVVGFALGRPGRDEVIWLSGDTVLYDGVREVADRLDVDIAVLHLGEVQFGLTGPLRYTMTAAQGMELLGLIRPRVAVPVHYEGWSHFQEGRAGVEAAVAGAPADVGGRVRLVDLGVPVAL